MRLIDVCTGNVEQVGFFCQMSRRKHQGWQGKLAWVRNRLKEGMRIRLLGAGERGFIEYMPGEFAWRPVEARGYVVIHCLWVVGRSKGKGYGDLLVEACVSDARRSGTKGVAMVTSEGNWLAGRCLLQKHGFEIAEEAEPSFSPMVRRFGKARMPGFTGEWEQKAKRFGKGLTVARTDQCPYTEDAVRSTRGQSKTHPWPGCGVERGGRGEGTRPLALWDVWGGAEPPSSQPSLPAEEGRRQTRCQPRRGENMAACTMVKCVAQWGNRKYPLWGQMGVDALRHRHGAFAA